MRPLLLLCVLLVSAPSALSETDGSLSRSRRKVAQGDAVETVTSAHDLPVDEAANDAVVKRLGKLEKLLSVLVDQRQDADVMFSRISTRLDALSNQQQAILQLLSTLPTRRNVQQGLVLGAPCRGDQDCSDLRADAVCSSEGRCVCGEGLQEVAGGACRPYPRLSEPCDPDCQGDHVTCSDRVCACASGYVNDNDTVCQPPRLSEACRETVDCQGVGTRCDGRACVCDPGYWNDNNATCQPYPNLSEPCNTTDECLERTDSSACVDNVCTCSAGSWQEDVDGFDYDLCLRAVGYFQECRYDVQCAATSKQMTCDDSSWSFASWRCRCATTGKADRREERWTATLRLDDSSCHSGFVEILYGDEWLPYWVCGNLSESDATVFCRSLHFSHGRLQLPSEQEERATYSQRIRYLNGGLDRVFLRTRLNDKFTCSGSEQNIDSCEWTPAKECDRSEIRPVALICFTE